MTTTTVEDVRRVLDDVYDPCSLWYGSDVTFTDLGMVHDIDIQGGKVSVTLVLDDPNCLYMESIDRSIVDAIQQLEGVEEVVVRNRGDILWTEEQMTDRGRERIRAQLEKRRQELWQIGQPDGNRQPAASADRTG